MSTLYLTPYRRMTSLRNAMDQLFNESFVRPAYVDGGLRFAVDVEARPEEFVLRANLPGLSADDLNVEVLEDTVTISGEIEVAHEDANHLLRERRGGKFTRTLTLPSELDASKASAELKNGVLTLTIPKVEAAQPRLIKVATK
ncbi:MAG: Hsp20/alpha crystallin family protein [Anaerolineales bacterium]